MIFQWLLEKLFGTCTRRSLARCEGCGVPTREGQYCNLCSAERMVDEPLETYVSSGNASKVLHGTLLEHTLYMP
jgi:hypothetical protein